jgi:hypothetical protein
VVAAFFLLLFCSRSYYISHDAHAFDDDDDDDIDDNDYDDDIDDVFVHIVLDYKVHVCVEIEIAFLLIINCNIDQNRIFSYRTKKKTILYRIINPLIEERIRDEPIRSDQTSNHDQNYLKRRASKAERKEKCSKRKER